MVGKVFIRPLDIFLFTEYVEAGSFGSAFDDAKKHILIVDDDPTYMGLIRGWLNGKYKVSMANSGMQAISWLANNKADLILIATKMSGLNSVLKELKNFISDNTVILSLINGVTSEEIIAERFGREKVLYSYFIGHSTVRKDNKVIHDDVNTIVFGSDNINDELNVKRVKDFFDKVGINYKIPDDIRHSMWAKFMLNVSANPTTALFRMNFGQMLNNEKFMELAQKIMLEVVPIAKAENIKNSETLVQETLNNLKMMSSKGRTSMLQDVESGRKTENDIFAGAIVKLGQKYNIDTPYCRVIDEFFKVIDN